MTEADMKTAREIALWAQEHRPRSIVGLAEWSQSIESAIAAALSHAQTDGRAEGLEDACAVVCVHCREALPFTRPSNLHLGKVLHQGRYGEYECQAEYIRAAIRSMKP